MFIPKIAVFISGRGSDLQAIIDNIEQGKLCAEIAIVISDKADAYGLVRAEKHNIPTAVIKKSDYTDSTAYEKAIVEILESRNVEHIILAGFMKILSPYFVRHYKHRILNIHPSLLPAFPGAHAHRDVINYGVKVSGCTVHFVDEGMDSGPIIAQAVVEVKDEDTEDSLAARVLAEEHKLYPKVIADYLNNRYKIDGRIVRKMY